MIWPRSQNNWQSQNYNPRTLAPGSIIFNNVFFCLIISLYLHVGKPIISTVNSNIFYCGTLIYFTVEHQENDNCYQWRPSNKRYVLGTHRMWEQTQGKQDQFWKLSGQVLEGGGQTRARKVREVS